MAEGGTSQDMERKTKRGTHFLEMAEGGTGQVMERKHASKGPYKLEMAEGGTSQDTERKQPSEGHSLSRDGRGRDKSGNGKKATEWGALTSWRWQREGQVRTWKESD